MTLTAAMLLRVFGVVDAPHAGWGSARTLTLSAGVLLLIVAFVLIERFGSDPLFDPRMLKGGDLISAAIFSAAIMGTYTSFQSISTLYLQQNRGWSPLQMALGFLPLSVLVAIVGPRVGRLIGAIGARRVIAIGFGIYTVAYLLFLRIDGSSSYWSIFLPTVVLIGFAFPLSFTGTYVQATNGVADRDQGVASAVAQTGYQIGSAVVLAVTTVIISANAPDGGALPSVADYRRGMFVICAIAVAALTYALVRVRLENRTAPAELLPKPIEVVE
jgi:Na+/melibiose symporter-like transporter